MVIVINPITSKNKVKAIFKSFLSIKNIKKIVTIIDFKKFDLSPVRKIVRTKKKSKINPINLYLPLLTKYPETIKQNDNNNAPAFNSSPIKPESL